MLYYIQAWHRAFYNDESLFDGKFQAWIHGPVNREIFDRFKDTKSLFSEMEISDVQDRAVYSKILEEHRNHIDSVIEAYGGFSGTELENMTHNEAPWILARKGYSPSERCEVEIDENIMGKYYRKRIGDK